MERVGRCEPMRTMDGPENNYETIQVTCKSQGTAHHLSSQSQGITPFSHVSEGTAPLLSPPKALGSTVNTDLMVRPNSGKLPSNVNPSHPPVDQASSHKLSMMKFAMDNFRQGDDRYVQLMVDETYALCNTLAGLQNHLLFLQNHFQV